MTKRVHYIGIDIGGTKIAVGLVCFPFRGCQDVLMKQVYPTRPERGSLEILEDCLQFAWQMIEKASVYDVAGIGIGVPELVDLEGNVTSCNTLDWRKIPVQSLFSQIAPSVVESDVRAGALAEALFGAGKPYRVIVYMTIGTGISHTLVTDGTPYAGARGNALICASSPLTTICEFCGHRLDPILDYYAAGPALVKRYNSRSNQVAKDAKDVFEKATRGDALALEILNTAGEAVGTVAGFLINVLDPQALIIGGGIGLAGGEYWDSLVRSTREHIWADNTRALPILRAELGIDAGLVGAAVSAAQKFSPEILAS